MITVNIAIGGLAAIVIAMNVVATGRVRKSDYYEPGQKRMQYALIWLVPLAGAILCYELSRQKLDAPSGRYRRTDTSVRGLDLGDDINIDDLSAGALGDLPD